MSLTNDERGWIMTGLSGLACILGASVICVDVIVRQFPGKQKFRIQDSDVFLSVSLSLSFGVMLFSSLYSMLPSAKSSLEKGGFSPKGAAWTLIACFIGGILGIQIVSNILHHFMPSHVVDCEHSHDDENVASEERSHTTKGDSVLRRPSGHPTSPCITARPSQNRSSSSYFGGNHSLDLHDTSQTSNGRAPSQARPSRSQLKKRPSLQQRLTASITSIAAPKPRCDCDGPCHGYTEPCGEDCFKKVQARGGTRSSFRRQSLSLRPSISKTMTCRSSFQVSENTPLLQNITKEQARLATTSTDKHQDLPASNDNAADGSEIQSQDSSSQQYEYENNNNEHHDHDHDHREVDDVEAAPDHHHHVPNNAFLSIGLQTSIAIALHKLPEGFITYATNHANPKLGFAVFLALFIHNITEGFALALPLYLAINSRFKAMVISFVLGGLSQPLGAAVAALWFKLAGSGDWAPDEGVYGGMFAVTAGIMASVALQLFGESLDLTHSKPLCMIGAFSGMAILGISNALTA